MTDSLCPLVITQHNAADDNPIVFVNAAFEQQTGYSFDDVVGKDCRFLQAPPTQQRLPSYASASIHRALQHGIDKQFCILNFRKDGTAMWNDLRIVPLHGADGRVTHHLAQQTFTLVQDLDPQDDEDDVLDESEDVFDTVAACLLPKSRSCGALLAMASSP
uniref:Putative LOV domain-containing protein n=1 Tax=Ignatius tetrasporus TaxID=231078 RepID=A0A126WYL6_9CHLO|nr:putative LOV domain-containing protein [Ignatius tetrasporus]